MLLHTVKPGMYIKYKSHIYKVTMTYPVKYLSIGWPFRRISLERLNSNSPLVTEMHWHRDSDIELISDEFELAVTVLGAEQ